MSKRQLWHNGDHFSSGKLIVALLLISLLAGQSGCASSKPYSPLPPPLSEEVKEELGTVGVTSTCFIPMASIQKPLERSMGAKVGAGEAFSSWMSSGQQIHDPYGLLAWIVLAPVAALAGGIVGTVKGVPSRQLKEAEEVLIKATSELKIQESMREYVSQVAEESTRNYLFSFDVQETPVTEVDYRFLAGEGIDTVLEISVSSFGLMGEKEKQINAPLYFFMNLHTRLVRTSDGIVLYSQELVYKSSSPRKFTEWASDSAKLYREEFTRCYQSLAEKVVKGIFLPCNLPPKPAQQSGSDGGKKSNHLK